MARNEIGRAVLFDLDGTLLDSFSAHYRAYERMLAQYGIVIDRASFLKSYFPDWQSTYRAFGLPEEQWKAANALWLEENAREIAPLRDGCMTLLAAIRERWRVGLVTSGSRARVMNDLQRTGLDAHLEVVVTGNDVEKRKPAPEGIHKALEHLGVTSERAVYVGDTPVDHETACAANVRFIGIRSEFSSMQVDPMVAALHELPRVLGSID